MQVRVRRGGMTGVLHIVVAMKPVEGNFAENAVSHGVAGLWVDGARVSTSNVLRGGAGGLLSNVRDGKEYSADNGYEPSQLGRWPANVVLGRGCPVKVMDEQSGVRPTGKWCRQRDGVHPFGDARGSEYEEWQRVEEPVGGASRFFKQVGEFGEEAT